MKAIIYILAVWLLAGGYTPAFSQQACETDKEIDLTGRQFSGVDKCYEARDKITMGQGFNYTRNDLSTKFNARLNENLFFPVVYDPDPIINSDLSISTDNFLGSTQGNSDVTGTGGYSYSIPILLPSGTHGMQPGVSVGYSSQSGNGLLGFGWTLHGISSITRSGRTLFHDGKVTGIQFTSEDIFLLDGNRLQVSNGAVYGSPETEYHTEMDDFSKIISYGGNNITGPERFEVHTKSGLTIQYGIPLNGENNNSYFPADNNPSKLCWYINTVTDNLGNYIRYNYQVIDGNIFIKEILYTGNSIEGKSPYNRVLFTYDQRTDESLLYCNGVEINNNVLLTSVKAYSKGYLFREYKFVYTDNSTNTSNYYSFLNEVIEISNGKQYNSLKFRYGEDDCISVYTVPVDPAVSEILSTDNEYPSYVVTGDYDGNGFTDMVCFYTSPGFLDNRCSSYKLFLNNNGVFELINSYSLIDTETNDIYTPYNPEFNSYLMNNIVDLNGDGKDELIFGKSTLIGTNPVYFYSLVSFKYVNDDHIFVQEKEFPIDYLSSYSDASVINGDFDGNRQEDIFVYNRLSESWNLFLNNNETAITGTFDDMSPPETKYNSVSSFYSIDIDGDGIAEIVEQISLDKNVYKFNIGSNEFSRLNYYCETIDGSILLEEYYGDFNGDNRLDKLYRRKDGEYEWMNLDLCLGYKAPPDDDGGGGDDFGLYVAHTKWYIRNNIGNGFWGEEIEVPLYCQDVSSASHYNLFWNYDYGVNCFYYDNSYKVMIGDYNGDGLSDILQIFDHKTGPLVNFKVLFSQGKNNFNERDIYKEIYLVSGGSHYYIDFNETTPFQPKLNILTGDFEGNGNIEILFHDQVLRLISVNDFDLEDGLNIDVGKDKHLLTSVYDGLGNLTKIKYKPLTDPNVYTPNLMPTYSFPLITQKTPPVYVVYLVQVPDGIGGINSTMYSYNGILIHALGRGFLGFEGMQIKNYTTKILVNIYKSINTEYYLPATISTSTTYKTTLETNPISNVLDNYVFHPFSTALSQKRFFQYPETSTVHNFLQGTTSVQTNNYSSTDIQYGNLTSSVLHLSNDNDPADIYTETTEYTNYISSGSWCPFLPNNISKSQQYQTKPVIENKTEYEYYPNGLVYKIKPDYDKPQKALTKEFLYDSYGNITNAKISSNDLPGIKEYKIEYDPTNRFAVKYTYPNDWTASMTYDSRLGLIKTQTDINNKTTSYEYDEFGNLVKVTDPTGIETIAERNWNPDPGLSDFLFYTNEYTKFLDDIISPYQKKYFDVLGRGIKTETNNIPGKTVCSDITYNNKGQIYMQSQPYFHNIETPANAINDYDKFGRLSVTTEINGSVTSYSYPYNTLLTTTSNNITGAKTVENNTMGQPVSVSNTSASTEITYVYRSDGQIDNITSNGSVIQVEYDEYNRQNKVIDPDAGTILYECNGLGQLISQTDNGKQYQLQYDELGRIILKEGPEGKYEYFYDPDPANKGLISRIESPNENVSYFYDGFGRLTSMKESIENKDFTYSYTYDEAGRITEKTYPTNPDNPSANPFKIHYEYNEALSQITQLLNITNSGTPQVIWSVPQTADAYNSKGQLLELQLGNGLNTYRDYTSLGLPISIKTGSSPDPYDLIQDYSYIFDQYWGRPTTRNNAMAFYQETFGYDEDDKKLNRLTSVAKTYTDDPPSGQNITSSYSFQLNGNIESTTNNGAYSYDDVQHVHAVTSIVNTNNIVSEDEQRIDYTPFNKVSVIKEILLPDGSFEKELNFTYGAGNQRIKTIFTTPLLTKTKFFIGEYELIEETGSETSELHYINGPMGLAAICVRDINGDQLYFTHTDHLGSITEITDQQGLLVQRMAYDAWGNRSRLVDNTGTGKYLLDRGYTTHEHLDMFGLINMNGRLYDPALGRMLSPDPFIQDPTNCQDYNRYSYCLNNPMVYTDPSGYQGTGYYIDGLWVSSNTFYNYLNMTSPGTHNVEGYGAEYELYRMQELSYMHAKRENEVRNNLMFYAKNKLRALFRKEQMGMLGNSGYYDILLNHDYNTNFNLGYLSEIDDKSSYFKSQANVGNFDYPSHMWFSETSSINPSTHFYRGASGQGDEPSTIKLIADYTIMMPVDFMGAAFDFGKNYYDMRKLNLINSDKYFHSKANFQATQRGPGGSFFAIHFSNLREICDQRIKGDTRLDALQDQEANIYGRNQGWLYRYYDSPLDFNKVLPKYRKEYFPQGY